MLQMILSEQIHFGKVNHSQAIKTSIVVILKIQNQALFILLNGMEQIVTEML